MGQRLSDAGPEPIPEIELQKGSIGQHRIIAGLGRGGMGDVFLALKQGIGGFSKLLVVKQLRPVLAADREFLQMFLDEARIASRLSHANLVQTYEVGQDESGHFYMTMDYIEGRSLHHLLNRAARLGVPVPLGLHLRIICEILAGIHHAHELKEFDGTPLEFVHRDLSPQNVMVSFDGEVKVLDFGISKIAGSTVETRVGICKGKMTCMAPEQLQGEVPTRRADVFAVGVMLWRAIAKRSMWGSLPASQIAGQLVGGNIPDVLEVAPKTPERLLRIVRKATAGNPEQRYATAAELRRDLLDYVTATRQEASPDALAALMEKLYGDDRRKMLQSIDTAVKEVESSDDSHQRLVQLPLIEGSSAARDRSVVAYANTDSVVVQPPGRGNLPLLLLGAGLVILGLGVAALAFVAFNRPQSDAVAQGTTPRGDNAASARPVLRTASVQFTASPKSAQLFVDGVAVTNPYQATFDVDGKRHHLRAAAEGYVSEERQLAFDADGSVGFALRQKASSAGNEALAQAVQRNVATSDGPRAATRGYNAAAAALAARRAQSPVSASATAKAATSAAARPASAPKIDVISDPQVSVIE